MSEFASDRERLAALQEIDRQLKEKADLAALLLAEADEIAAQLEHRRAEVSRMAEERSALETQRIELDSRLDVEGARIRDSRMKMNRARNDKEVLALQHQVNVTKEMTKQLEEQVLAIMESLESLTQRLNDAEQALQGSESTWLREIASRRERARLLHEEIAAERGRRDMLAQGLDGSLRSKYEQIFARRGGTAVVEVRNGTCQGCHMHVPPQLYNELQKFQDIRQCPNCHRILFWRPDADNRAEDR